MTISLALEIFTEGFILRKDFIFQFQPSLSTNSLTASKIKRINLGPPREKMNEGIKLEFVHYLGMHFALSSGQSLAASGASVSESVPCNTYRAPHVLRSRLRATC